MQDSGPDSLTTAVTVGFRRDSQKVKCSDVFIDEGSSAPTSTSLLLRAQANDTDAWTQLVETYSRRVYRWCRHAGLQPADAANVVQEVLRAVARKLPEFRRDRETDSFRGWLRRITQNKLRDYYRQQTRHPDRGAGGTDAHHQILSLRDPWTTAGVDASGTHSVTGSPHRLTRFGERVIERVRAEFSERDWRFFWRVVVDGQSAVDVGREFAVSANAVRLVKMRILRRLREEIARGSEET